MISFCSFFVFNFSIYSKISCLIQERQLLLEFFIQVHIIYIHFFFLIIHFQRFKMMLSFLIFCWFLCRVIIYRCIIIIQWRRKNSVIKILNVFLKQYLLTSLNKTMFAIFYTIILNLLIEIWYLRWLYVSSYHKIFFRCLKSSSLLPGIDL